MKQLESPEINSSCLVMNEKTCRTMEKTLVTDKFVFYCDLEEDDENASTKMFDRRMHLLSNNYFAFAAMVDEMQNIYLGKTHALFMSDAAKEGYAQRMTEFAEN